MTTGKAVGWSIGIVLIGTVIVLGTLADVRTSIRERYPSAEVALHEGRSPALHPVLSIMRVFRGRQFIPATEWVAVQLTDEAQPIDLTTLFQFRVAVLKLIRCKITDVGPLLNQTHPIYAELLECDVNVLPAEQKGALRTSPENPQRLTYGAP